MFTAESKTQILNSGVLLTTPIKKWSSQQVMYGCGNVEGKGNSVRCNPCWNSCCNTAHQLHNLQNILTVGCQHIIRHNLCTTAAWQWNRDKKADNVHNTVPPTPFVLVTFLHTWTFPESWNFSFSPLYLIFRPFIRLLLEFSMTLHRCKVEQWHTFSLLPQGCSMDDLLLFLKQMEFNNEAVQSTQSLDFTLSYIQSCCI